jgi:hypothetical protein
MNSSGPYVITSSLAGFKTVKVKSGLARGTKVARGTKALLWRIRHLSDSEEDILL